MLFAEALSQALAAGLDISKAVAVTAEVVPTRRFRAALREMATNCRSGYTLAASLAKTGVAVRSELLSALEVGEKHGILSGELASFASRHSSQPGVRLAASLHRPREVTRFAAALARLLEDRKMTIGLVEDAAKIAAGAGSAFVASIGRVTEAMREGSDFSQSLNSEKNVFDPLFCALVGAPDARVRLRMVLARLGE